MRKYITVDAEVEVDDVLPCISDERLIEELGIRNFDKDDLIELFIEKIDLDIVKTQQLKDYINLLMKS